MRELVMFSSPVKTVEGTWQIRGFVGTGGAESGVVGGFGASVVPGWKAMGFRQRPCFSDGRDGNLQVAPLILGLLLELRPLQRSRRGAVSI
jgi:hypothetical protein